MFRMTRVAALGVALALTHCGAGTAQVKTVLTCEVGCKTPNVSAPTHLNVWMNAGGTIAEIRVRCDNMGGSDLVQPRHTRNLVCEDVDY